MPVHDYSCPCGEVFERRVLLADLDKPVMCRCGKQAVRLVGSGGITTEDSYWIRNKFRDKKTGVIIDSWKKWEAAGFKDPLNMGYPAEIHQEVKRKVEKEKYYDTRKRFSVVMGG